MVWFGFLLVKVFFVIFVVLFSIWTLRIIRIVLENKIFSGKISNTLVKKNY